GLPCTIEAATKLIETELSQSGYSVERQTYDVRGQEAVNLIAEIPGSSRADEIVILGAHYDTIPATPGADDNASAVAVLLATARLMRACKPKRTIRFVAFACEEAPHFNIGEMGSQDHARRCRSRGEKIVGMLCLEMVGYYSTEPHSQRIPPTIPRSIRWLFP